GPWRQGAGMALPLPTSRHGDQPLLAKSPDTAWFRAGLAFCAVETGLAGWDGRNRTFASESRSVRTCGGSTLRRSISWHAIPQSAPPAAVERDAASYLQGATHLLSDDTGIASHDWLAHLRRHAVAAG